MKHIIMLLLLITFLQAYTYDETVIMLDTPSKIGRWMKGKIKYVFVLEATPYRSSREVFRSRSGGCTDYAQFAYELLTYHGIPCDVYEVWNDKRGHSFVVYKNSIGKYNCLDSMYGNSEFSRFEVNTIAKLLYPDKIGFKRIKGTL